MPDRSVGAGTITLRLDDLLVGIAVDTVDTLDRCRVAVAPWIDDTQPNITPAFDLRLAEDRGWSGAFSAAVAPRRVRGRPLPNGR